MADGARAPLGDGDREIENDRKPGIAAAIIAKDEEREIVRCIESLAGLDEIVLADTGSRDRTAKIAASLGAFVIRLPHRDPFHFGEARQAALEATRRQWVLSIDADELLVPGGLEILRNLAASAGHAWEIGFLQRASHDAKPVRHYLKRFFLAARHRWAYRIHEQIVSVGDAVVGREPRIVLEHLPSKNRERRKGQNFKLLQLAVEESPDYAHLHFYLAQEFWMRNRFEEALASVDRYLERSAGEQVLWVSEAKLFKGMLLGKMGKVDEAIRALEAAWRTCPSRREPLIHAGELERARGRLGSAMAFLDRALEIPADEMPDFPLNWPSAWGRMPHKMLRDILDQVLKSDPGFWEKIPPSEGKRLKTLAQTEENR